MFMGMVRFTALGQRKRISFACFGRGAKKVAEADFHQTQRERGQAEEDVDQMVHHLREHGIEPVHPPTAPVQGPMLEPIVHGWMPAAAVFFRDPDGHLLELIAELSEAPRPNFIYRSLSEWRTLVGTERKARRTAQEGE